MKFFVPVFAHLLLLSPLVSLSLSNPFVHQRVLPLLTLRPGIFSPPTQQTMGGTGSSFFPYPCFLFLFFLSNEPPDPMCPHYLPLRQAGPYYLVPFVWLLFLRHRLLFPPALFRLNLFSLPPISLLSPPSRGFFPFPPRYWNWCNWAPPIPLVLVCYYGWSPHVFLFLGGGDPFHLLFFSDPT